MGILDEFRSQSVDEFRADEMEGALDDASTLTDAPVPDLPTGENAEIRCPECDRTDFVSERGLKKHRTQTHGIQTPKADKPPKSVRSIGTTKAASVQKVQDHVEHWFGFAQVGLLASGDQYCAWAIGQEGPFIAKSLAEVSQDFPMVKKVIEAGDKW